MKNDKKDKKMKKKSPKKPSDKNNQSKESVQRKISARISEDGKRLETSPKSQILRARVHPLMMTRTNTRKSTRRSARAQTLKLKVQHVAKF